MRRGNCYVACEALYHALKGNAGGVPLGLKPHRMPWRGDMHWFLAGVDWSGTWVIVDPTAKQWKRADRPTTSDYMRAVGCGFLTKKPSKRARALLRQMLFQRL